MPEPDDDLATSPETERAGWSLLVEIKQVADEAFLRAHLGADPFETIRRIKDMIDP